MDKSSTHIAGFWFHIDWNNKGVGKDQYGNEWRNKENPEPVNQKVTDTCLDGYNDISKEINKLNK